MTFQLDTSGFVPFVRLDTGRPVAVEWTDLSPFTQGYVEAMFAAHSIRLYRSDIDQTFSHGAFDMLAPETLARIIADCEAADHLRPGVSDDGDRSAGRGFWELRQSGAYADRFPPLTVQLGDDGKVRFA